MLVHFVPSIFLIYLWQALVPASVFFKVVGYAIRTFRHSMVTQLTLPS